MIPRFIEKQVLSSLKPGKVCAVFGPRRGGKTVFLQMIKEKLVGKKILLVHGENYSKPDGLTEFRQTRRRRTGADPSENSVIPN